jgi:hypothetical protein
MRGELLEYPNNLPWIRPSKELKGNPSWLKVLFEIKPETYQVLITLVSESRKLNDYLDFDISSIEKTASINELESL